MTETTDQPKNTLDLPMPLPRHRQIRPIFIQMLLFGVLFSISVYHFVVTEQLLKSYRAIRPLILAYQKHITNISIILISLFTIFVIWQFVTFVKRRQFARAFVVDERHLTAFQKRLKPVLSPIVPSLIQHIRQQQSSVEGAQLQRREYQLRSEFAEDIVRTVPTGILVLTQSLYIRSINAAARSFLDVHMLDLQGKDIRQLAELPSALQSAIEQTFSATTSEQNIKGLSHKNYILDCQIRPVRGVGGTKREDILVLLEDVTEREKARAHMLDNERMAVMGRMGAQITHEIRNPLSSIGLNVELLGDDALFLPEARQQEFKQIVGSVRQEVDRLSELTEAYLRLARLPDTGLIHVDFSELLEDIVDFQQFEAERAEIKLIFKSELEQPNRLVAPGRIRQAVLNIIRNAMEAIGKNGTIRVRLYEKNQVVIIQIDDSGPGIPIEIRSRIFDSTYTTKSDGNGLGLAVCAEVCREYDGTAIADVSPLGGARIEMHLRLTEYLEMT